MKIKWILFCLIFYAPIAKANLYLETGFGLGQIRHSSALFGEGAPHSTHFGFAQNATLGYIFGSSQSITNLHLGFHERMTTGTSEDGTEFGIMGVYPTLRIELTRLLIGAGGSPFVWARRGSGSGSWSNYSRIDQGFGIYVESALVWRVVPFFHITVGPSFETIINAGTLSPKPAIQGTIQLRFFIMDGFGSGRSRRKFDGWRYPFGIEMF